MIRLLIADDESFVLRGIQMNIPWGDVGIDQIELASNGVEALEKARNMKPDILLTDVRMPIMDGIELSQNISVILPKCRFIFMSAFSDIEYLKSAIELDVIKYIDKPISLNEIIDTLAVAVSDVNEERKKEEKIQLYRNDIEKNQAAFYQENLEAQRVDYKRPINYELSDAIMNEFDCALKTGDKSKLFGLVDVVTNDIKKHVNTPVDYVKNIYYRLNLLLQSDARKKNISFFKDNSELFLWERIYSFNTLHEIKEFTLRSIDEYLEKLTNTDPYWKQVTRIIAFIDSFYSEPDLTIKFISNKMYLSESYLCVIFKKSTGMTINTYITKTRIEKSKMLLRDDRLKLADVAIQVGYKDDAYFTKVFKRLTSYLPSEYRNLRLI